MELATTLYLITTAVLFGINALSNMFVLTISQNKNNAVSTFIATILAFMFLIWAIALLVGR